MNIDIAKRIGAFLTGSVLIGCGGGGNSTSMAETASAEAAEAAKQAAAMVAVTPVPRECTTE
jgi:hypothetical protein